MERDLFLLNQGWKVLRFKNRELVNNIEHVVDQIYEEIGRVAQWSVASGS